MKVKYNKLAVLKTLDKQVQLVWMHKKTNLFEKFINSNDS